MSERTQTILSYLNDNLNYYIPSSSIGERLQVSVRTIKRDIKELNEELSLYGARIISNHTGYKIDILDEEVYRQFIRTDFKFYEGNAIWEIKQIIELLVSHPYTSQDKISEALYLSKSTINKYMLKVKERLSEFGIVLKTRPHYGYCLYAKEIDIRNCIAKYIIYQDDFHRLYLPERLKHFFNCSTAEFVKQVADTLGKCGLVKNDMETAYISSYIMASTYRCYQGNKVVIEDDIKFTLENKVFSASKKIAENMKQQFGVAFGVDDIIYIAYIIGNSPSEINKENTETLAACILDCINRVYEECDVDFSMDEALIEGLVSHLFIWSSRYFLNATIANPLISMVKSKYIEAYNYTILFTHVLKEKYHLELSEDDIGYVALHFAASLERDIMKSQVRVIIVSNGGAGTVHLLKSMIQGNILNIRILGAYPSNAIPEDRLNEVDLILTTEPIITELDKENIEISSLLTEEEIEQIKDYISQKRDYKYLLSLIKEDIYFHKIHARTKEEVIRYLCCELKKGQYINEAIEKAILEREEISPTEINDLVAIPHCIIKAGKASMVAVGILDTPILWDKKYVQIVFLGALDPAVKKNRKIFTMLYKLTKRADKIKELITCNNVEDFKALLVR